MSDVSPLELIEIKDGLLSSENKEIMKARCPELFPETIQAFFQDKEKVCSKKMEFGIYKVTVKTENKRAIFDSVLIDYIKSLGKIEYYLSNVPLPCEDGEYYPLFAKYKYGWCIVAPLGA